MQLSQAAGAAGMVKGATEEPLFPVFVGLPTDFLAVFDGV
jgi:hypothetical protein